MNTVVISGASRGIGKALASLYLSKGYFVSGTCSSTETKAQAMKDLPGLDLHVVDMCNKDEVFKYANYVLERDNKIEILINNAGAYSPGSLADESDENFEYMLNVNLKSAYYLTKSFLPSMMENKDGTIVNMCSVASLKAYPGGGSYCIAKHALLGMSRTLREELIPAGIRVVSIIPGAVYTDSWKDSGLPKGRFITTEQLAQTVWMSTSMGKEAVVEEIVIRPFLGDI